MSNFSDAAFTFPSGNFPQGSLSYFTVPTWPANGIPPGPAASISRNMFRGPGFIGNDFVLAKAFGLPQWKFLGENGKLSLQASASNLFNSVNLTQLNTTISNDGVTNNPQFGQAQNVLAAT